MKKLLKPNNLLTLVGGVLAGVLVFVVTYNSPIWKRNEPKEPTCNVVTGKEHIYRGDCLPEGFTPEVLPLTPRASWLDTEQYLDIKAKVLVEQLIADAEKDGMCLVVTSGYRSAKDQQELHDNTPEDKKIYVAKAGESEHQTGLAVDFAACPMLDGVRDDPTERPELANDFETLPEYSWLKFNAYKYGFEQSFTVENIADSQYPVESWHWKLVIK